MHRVSHHVVESVDIHPILFARYDFIDPVNIIVHPSLSGNESLDELDLVGFYVDVVGIDHIVQQHLGGILMAPLYPRHYFRNHQGVEGMRKWPMSQIVAKTRQNEALMQEVSFGQTQPFLPSLFEGLLAILISQMCHSDTVLES